MTFKKRDLQNIADFMTLNIDTNLQVLQTDLSNWFRKNKKLRGETTTLVLYDLIKKRCNFDIFITQLSNNSEGSTEEMLFT
jgi:hypothetical protein